MTRRLRVLRRYSIELILHICPDEGAMAQPRLKSHTIEHENKREEILTRPGQGAALEDETMPHSDRGAWKNVGPLQDVKGSGPNAKDPNEPYRQHGGLPKNQPGAVGGE